MYPSSKQLITPPPSLKNILAEVTHQNFTNLHGLLHPIVPVSSTMNNQDLEMVNMLTCIDNYCQHLSPQPSTSLSKKIPTEVIHPNVSDPPDLLLLVVLAVHGVIDHQLT